MLLMKALVGKRNASTRDGDKSAKLHSSGDTTALLFSFIVADRDDSTLTALSLTGCVAERSQSLDSFNLGEKGPATLIDLVLRMSGLLAAGCCSCSTSHSATSMLFLPLS